MGTPNPARQEGGSRAHAQATTRQAERLPPSPVCPRPRVFPWASHRTPTGTWAHRPGASLVCTFPALGPTHNFIHSLCRSRDNFEHLWKSEKLQSPDPNLVSSDPIFSPGPKPIPLSRMSQEYSRNPRSGDHRPCPRARVASRASLRVRSDDPLSRKCLLGLEPETMPGWKSLGCYFSR